MSDSKVVINQINRGTDGTMFGHVWIVVTDSKGVEHSYGFTPNDTLIGGIPSPWSEGKVEARDNIIHPNPDFSKEYSISDAQAQKIIAFGEKVKANPGPYNLEGMNNCTTFAAKALVNAGVVPKGGMLPGIPGTIPNWVRAKGIQIENMKRILSGPRVLRKPSGGVGGVSGGRGASGMGGGAGNAGSAGTRPPLRDPLVLDLDGDGIETTSSRDGTIILFDHNSDGVKTGGGWIKPDDGWLVFDRNGNGEIDSGRELFGVDTLKQNGEFALNGFDALGDFDKNGDNKVDANDANFGSLKIWRDINQDGISQSQELSTLSENGILSINTNSINNRVDLGNGNVQTAAGMFNRVGGGNGQIGETSSTVANLDLLVDTFYRKFIDTVPLTQQALSLPELFGSGRVRNLREAISLSTDLGDFVQNYVGQATRRLQIEQLDRFIQLWADTSDIKSLKQQAKLLEGSGVSLVYHLEGFNLGSTEFDSFIDKLGVVERFMGFTYGGVSGEARFDVLNPSSGVLNVSLSLSQISTIELAYSRLKADIYESMLPQTRMRRYMDLLELSILEGDFSAKKIEDLFVSEISQNGQESIIDLVEFISSVGYEYLSELGWDSRFFLFQQLINSSALTSFSQELTEWTVKFNDIGSSSNFSSKRGDILVRKQLSETIFADDGDDFVLTGSGNDALFGGNGDDFLSGGSGNDILNGGDGNNLYAWGLNGGQDRIESFNGTVDHADRLLILGSIKSSDLLFRRVDSDLLIGILGSTDSLRIKNAFTELDELNLNSIVSEIVFADGSSINAQDVQVLTLLGASQNDYLRGFVGNDVLNGFEGDDMLEGGAGDDVFFGGLGDDIQKGGIGNDLYQIELNWGKDKIIDLAGKSVIYFGAGITRENLSIVRNGDDIVITDKRNNSTIIFTAYSSAGDLAYLNSEIQFDNGEKLTLRDFLAIELTCTNGNDHINGTSLDDNIIGLQGSDTLVGNVGNDLLQGDAGDDFLDGGEGNDILIGGVSNDILLGGAGNDTYRFGRNQGSDFLLDRTAGAGAGGEDKIVLDVDVLPTHVSLHRTSSANARYYNANNVDDLILVIDGSAQQLCIADFFSSTDDSAIESIVFGNGVVWSKQDILSKLIDQSGPVSTLTASAGDDSFVVDNSLDQIEGVSGGIDRVMSSVSYELPQSVRANIELTGTLNIDASSYMSGSITGNSGDNILRKNGLGDFYYDHATLAGGKGDDQYYARGFMDRNGAKLDEINADKIIDTVIENAGEGYDTIFTTAYNATLPANVEKLVVSGEAMYAWYTPTSTYIVNHFNGNELDNVIDASGIIRGNPIIDGGQGKDMMIGGTGDDTFIVDNIDDVVVETLLTNYVDSLSALTGDTVEASVNYTLAKNIEHLTLTGSVAINGIGNDANNRLDGSKNAAVNHLTGGKGDDTYIVDTQDVVHENDGEGRDTVAFNKPGDYQLSAYQNIENIAFEDWAYELNAANSITGNASDNVLTGNSASNVLVGGAGNDLIYDCSKEGSRRINSSQYALTNDADHLIGGSGNDTLISYSGADTLDGGDGDDQLLGGKGDTSFVFGHGYGRDRIISDSGDWGASYAGDSLIFKADVHANEVVLVRNGTTLSVQLQGSADTLDIDNFFSDQATLTLNNSIEKIIFSDGSFWDNAAILARLESNNLNTLTSGNDLFAGSGSDDVIDALAGDDFIQGDSGNDTILGNTGNDTIFGGAGTDTLIGGIGNDVLVGGVDGDVYRFTRGFGKDFVEEQGVSSTTEIDTIVFDNTIFPADVRVEFGVGESESAIFLKIKGGDDQIILRSSAHTTPWSTYYLYQNGVENVQFADGTIWNAQDLIAKATANINHAPYTMNGIRDQAGQNGAPFHFAIPSNAFGDQDVDDVLTYSATLADGSPLPNWLSFNSLTGTFSGTIDAVDTIYINVTASDRGNLSTSTSFGIYLGQDQTITGTAANDNLRGGIGNDTIYGLAGNDTFYGGYGNDTFVGGAGNEYYSVEDEGDVIVENANEGDDFVRSQVSYSLNDNVERLALDGGSDISATGNTLNNGLWGNDANNLLIGAKGNDYLSGGLGNDVYVFNRGDGQDTIDNLDLLTASDTVRFVGNITDSDVTVSKSSNTLFLKIKGTTDQIGISNYYAVNTVIDGAPADYKIEKVEFSNGVSWNQAMIQTMVDRALTNRAPTLSTPITNLTTKADQTISFTVPANTIIDADVGDSVTYSLKMKDGTALPAWLSFNASSRLISGTPLAANVGILNLTLWGTDNYGLSVGQNLTMTVAAANRAPVLSVPLLDQVAAPQSAFAYTVPSNSFTDPDVGDALSYSASLADGSSLPAWLSFNPSTRAFAGTPTLTETLSLKVSVKDTSNLAISDVFNITVKVSDLNLTGTTNADTLTGGVGNDTLSGLAGNDKLTGNAGNDLLDGGAGSDTLIGGLGDDTYIVDVTTDVVNENANEGSDMIKSSVSLILAVNVENLTLTGTTAINGTGNALNNVLTGNSAINTLDGGVGADTLAGAAGNDIYTVDNINDVIVENASEGTDQVNSSVSFTLSANVENLTLTGTAHNNATGNAAANTLTGNAGNNVLDGGAGNDIMVGGAGNDTYVVDSSGDTVTEAASAGNDLVQSSVNYTLGTNLENLTLTGTANINATGNTAANILFGNSGNNVLDGGTGADTMTGGAGNDIYVRDNTGDVITENASEGIDQVKSSLTYTLIANLESLLLTGTTAINGTGNALDNLLIGNSGKNILNGGAGNDILQGVAGDDTLTDTAGSNIFDGGAGIDVITAGTGNDFIVGGLGNDTITTSTGVDVVAFNRGDGMDTLVASTGKDNTLSLGKGIKYADLLFKKSGNDLILVTGTSEQVTMKDWYTNVNNRSIANLQIVIEGTTDYNAASTNKLNNKKIEQFNFDGLVNKFDQARAANPSLTSWALSSSLLEFYLNSSDTAAIGGDLAYQYAKSGNLSAFSMTPAQALLSSAQYGNSAQALQSTTSLQDSSVRLM